MILQKDLSGESLANELKNLIESPEKITQMEISAKKMVKGDAAALMVNLIEDLARKGNK